MGISRWKISLSRELIRIQHMVDDPKLKSDIAEVLEVLRQARRRDLYEVLVRLNSIITNYGLKSLLRYVEELEGVLETAKPLPSTTG